jgi:hypothetical protein
MALNFLPEESTSSPFVSSDICGLQGAPALVQKQGNGLLPFARAFVPEVDLAAGFMEVAPPPGWLEMYLEPVQEKRQQQKSRGKRGAKRSGRDGASDRHKNLDLGESPADGDSSSFEEGSVHAEAKRV